MILREKRFCENLHTMRLKYGYTQAALIEQMQLKGSSMTTTTYSKIETGLRNIKAGDLVAIREVYGASFDEFFEGVSP